MTMNVEGLIRELQKLKNAHAVVQINNQSSPGIVSVREDVRTRRVYLDLGVGIPAPPGARRENADAQWSADRNDEQRSADRDFALATLREYGPGILLLGAGLAGLWYLGKWTLSLF